MQKIILPNETIRWKLSGAEFVLYALLTSFGEKPFELSFRQMSLLSGLSEATVKRAVKLLEGRGLLIHAARIRDHRRTVNRYKVLKRANRRRFFCLPAEAIGLLTPSELLVYAYLICRAGRNKKAYASEYLMAEELNISRTTVRNCTAKLAADGWIGKEKRSYEKNRKTGAYRSFAYDLGSKSEKNDPPECAESDETNPSKGICLPGWFAPYSEDMGLAVGQTDFVPKRLIFRPPKPQNLPP